MTTYYEKNKERIKEQRRLRYRNSEAERYASKYRKKTYGLSDEEYYALLDAQEWCCAICAKPVGQEKLDHAIDHDHDTGDVRGILCRLCNLGIGYFRDQPELLDAAKDYLT
jgi:hypothetical protein